MVPPPNGVARHDVEVKHERPRTGRREVLERIATSGKLNIVLGKKGLAERVVNLL